ncbi:hypothetical protein GCM10007415_10200 [Parapedobacter pyrenivorans]|uniref:Amidohydrolase-related domain-containing protein n=1 Tax=Parapedobacter pyrenivorans TaxID=1305674 RepID=A0A917HIM0_9SPHI|nr:ketose-bisphosphate aldolase [Parapedobacter pyrenivorans]GGG79854.1 hypothetical protein GCM10007415_10200 [Parapedobacter pyrenivorans]
MTLTDKLQALYSSNGCLLATNFYNFETLSGVMAAASELQQPIILQVTKGSIDYLGLSMAVSMAKSALAGHEAGGWLHLDHAESYDLIARCLDAGFDSVMIDYSERPFHENVVMTKKVVKLAEQYNANVEAELGYVAKLGQTKAKLGFTEPEEARQFVYDTGVHALAVAIGSAHGFYTETPKLDLERLSAIKEATKIPLVLHGGSGIPANVLQESIQRGICKINLATEIKDTFMRNLKRLLSESDEIDLRKVFPPATQAVSALVKEKLETVAGDYTLEDFPAVPKYDVHTHANIPDGRLVEFSKSDNFKLLSINLIAPGFPPLEEQLAISVAHLGDYRGDFAFACNFPVNDWEHEDWAASTIARIEQARAAGAVAVKVWKNIGMELRDTSGKFIMIDHPRFDPIMAHLVRHQIPLIGHLGEPRNCWLPLEEMTVSSDRSYFSDYPQYHMFLHPSFPSYEEQIAARDRLLAKFPQLRFVGAHLASLEWSVDELAKRLDAYPNMMVDTAERICHLQHQAVSDWQHVRDFFMAYQDRIMYGTDIVDDGSEESESFRQRINTIRKRHWQFFTTTGLMEAPKVTGAFRGMGLPRSVVDKIYRINAEKTYFA